MADATIDFEEKDAELTVHPRGRIDRRSVRSLWEDSEKKLRETSSRQVAFDFQEVSGIDSSGVAYLRTVETLCEERGIAYKERNVPEHLGEFLRYTRRHSSLHLKEEPSPPAPDPITRVGLKIKRQNRNARDTIAFFGEFLIAATERFRRPVRSHVREIFYHLELVGAGAVPLIAALSLLLGMLMVFQGKSSLQGFGPKIYVADMVVIAVTREMGPLVVGVILAGRSGAAFAAEIGTMKVNEELDALTVMNLDVTRLIILPRVFALALAEPILTMIADVVGIIGGLTTGKLVMGIPIHAFVHEVRSVLTQADIYTGLLKAVTFGVLTGFIGCFSGLRTGMGSGSVGVQTTAAVVRSIFVIILIDTIYSYIFSLYGW